MAERCVNRFDSSPIRVPEDASSGPLDVADGNIMGSPKAMAKAVQAHQGPEYEAGGSSFSQLNGAPPLDISNYLDLFRSMGQDRLVPVDLMKSAVYPHYQTYLKEFYRLHKNSADDSIVDAAFKCLKKENSLRLYWLLLKADITPSDAFLSNDIYDCMLQVVQNGSESEAPFFIDAAACIAKEARLIMKYLRQGWKVPDSQYALSQDIRRLALKFAMFQGKWSPDIAAVLLGITKEAELLENMSGCYLDAIDTSSKIRRFALEFLIYESIDIDEMASDDDDEVNLPTRGKDGEFGMNNLEKKLDNMVQPKQKANGGFDISSLSEEVTTSSLGTGRDYLTIKSIIATEYM